MINIAKLLVLLLFLSGCSLTQPMSTTQSLHTEQLIIEKLSDHTYRHISYLKTNDFGKVACNGMVVTDGKEAIIFDTPTDNETSAILINWVETNLQCKVKAVIATHFHDDCLAGLPEFHQRGIPSYANHMTIKLAKQHNATPPLHGFNLSTELVVGKEKVLIAYFGEGHTRDNVIGYFPSEKVMFGGCLIKELGAGKGNLEDANTTEWPKTVKKLKTNYPAAKIVIPGHGKPGNISLLDYTIQLFENK
ncbi:subclass B1 metallo-beta-lactamase [Pedobacter sp. CAN_A7]|uniref:subclass B1 metallo-beta-lactamase n=1 Tax=Pedobacter sp. CAN_A7 TaxID=2787722 RepID=UPI0018C99588